MKARLRPQVILLGFVSLLNDSASEMIHPLLPLFERNPEGWSSVVDQNGRIQFDGSTPARLIALARVWSKSRAATAK